MRSLRERWWSTPNRVIKPGWSDISCNPRQLQWDDDMLHSHFSLRFCEWTPHSVLDRTYNSNLFLAHLCSKHVAYCRAKKLWNPHLSQWTSHFPPMNSWFWDDPTISLFLWMTSRWMRIRLHVFMNFAEWAHPKLWMKSSFCVWTGDLTGESVNKGHGPPKKNMTFVPDEHTGLVILAILGILAYPVAILTWAPGMSATIRCVAILQVATKIMKKCGYCGYSTLALDKMGLNEPLIEGDLEAENMYIHNLRICIQDVGNIARITTPFFTCRCSKTCLWLESYISHFLFVEWLTLQWTNIDLPDKGCTLSFH